MKRMHSIDCMRGFVMIVMTLDHVRDLLHTTSILQQPTDLQTTTPALFFTRWITHLCAPTFVFLSGVAAFLSMKRRNDIRATRRYLLTRGAWLIVLEFTVINFGLWFDIHFKLFLFNVIAAIGCGFIILALLLTCSTKTIGIMGLTILFLHNLSPLAPAIIRPLFSPGAFPLPGNRLLVMGYPPVPWLGLMLVGFACGRFFAWDSRQRKSLFLKLGMASIALFILLRCINRYGDTAPWSPQKNGLFTFLSFINVTKYPPSLQFCLLFAGIMFLILYAIDNIQNRWTIVVSVYGQVPLFYFLVHWYILHPLVFIMVYLQGFTSSDMVFGFHFGRPKSGSGLPLWAIYLVWISMVAAMYPLCKWYARYRQNQAARKRVP
jgi:uncharacterized membrane protein